LKNCLLRFDFKSLYESYGPTTKIFAVFPETAKLLTLKKQFYFIAADLFIRIRHKSNTFSFPNDSYVKKDVAYEASDEKKTAILCFFAGFQLKLSAFPIIKCFTKSATELHKFQRHAHLRFHEILRSKWLMQ